MHYREKFSIVLWRILLLPHYTRDKILFTKDFIHNHSQAVGLVVVDRHKNCAIIAQQFAQQLQARPDHTQPLVVAGQVFAANNIVQPFDMHGVADIIVVHPAFIASVVWRVDIDTLHLARECWQQRLERQQIITMHNDVTIEAEFLGTRLIGNWYEAAIWNGEMVRLDRRFPFELDRWRGKPMVLRTCDRERHNAAGMLVLYQKYDQARRRK